MSTGLAQTVRALPHSSGMPMPMAWSLHRNRFIELPDFERPEHIVRPSQLRTPECCFGVEFAGSSNRFSSYWSLHVTPYAPPDLRFYKGGTVAATALPTRAEGQRIGTMRTRTSVPLGHYPDPSREYRWRRSRMRIWSNWPRLPSTCASITHNLRHR